MNRPLWQHQKQMLRYTYMRRHPILFVDPRMGKSTVFIQRTRQYSPRDATGLRVLIVAPNSALGSWVEELLLAGEAWYKVLEGTRAERLEQLGKPATWNLAHPDIHLHIPEIADVAWDCVCLDESTVIKNYKSRRARFWVNNFRDVPHRWAMTGTPNPEHLLEFWPQMAWADGSAFGFRNYWEARKRLFHVGFGKSDYEPNPGTQERITAAVASRACIIRRKDVNLEPTKNVLRRYHKLPARLAASYRKIEDAFALVLDGNVKATTMWAGAQYVWLRRLAGGFLDRDYVWKEEIADVVHLLDSDYHSESVVVWAGFKLEIKELTKAIKKAGRSVDYITGEVPPDQRRALVARFNDGQIATLVIQHQVGETGMRLSKADVAIYYSNPLGNMTRMQTEDRIVHLGKLDRPLTLIEMITRGTVDEDISRSLRVKAINSKVTMDACLRAQFRSRRSER